MGRGVGEVKVDLPSSFVGCIIIELICSLPWIVNFKVRNLTREKTGSFPYIDWRPLKNSESPPHLFFKKFKEGGNFFLNWFWCLYSIRLGKKSPACLRKWLLQSPAGVSNIKNSLPPFLSLKNKGVGEGFSG